MTTDSDLRYTFVCPSCAASFSISLEKIPPVQARFSCPKCGKPMDFPSREEARVYIRLQSTVADARTPEAESPEAVSTPRGSTPTPSPSSPAPASAPMAEPPAPDAEKRYAVEKKGFEGDAYDRRAMRNLIRSGAINEFDSVRAGEAAAVRAADLPELKSLFELRKSARATPPAVCRAHTDVMAFYLCSDSGRPLCDECAQEKKFGGTSVRVCTHCGGTVREMDHPLES